MTLLSANLWKDTITGVGRKLGMLFLADVITGQLRMSMTDPSKNDGPTLGKLMTQVLFMKNTAWGARIDLDVHRSYAERSMIPYVILSLLIHRQRALSLAQAGALPADAAPGKLPALDYSLHSDAIQNGLSTANRLVPDAEEEQPRTMGYRSRVPAALQAAFAAAYGGQDLNPVAKYIEDLLAALQPMVHHPSRLETLRALSKARTEVSATDAANELVSVAASLRTTCGLPPVAPAVEDVSCARRTLHPYSLMFDPADMSVSNMDDGMEIDDETIAASGATVLRLSPSECQALAYNPLSMLDGAARHVVRVPVKRDGTVRPVMPFDLANHPEATSVVAQQLLRRLHKDLEVQLKARALLCLQPNSNACRGHSTMLSGSTRTAPPRRGWRRCWTPTSRSCSFWRIPTRVRPARLTANSPAPSRAPVRRQHVRWRRCRRSLSRSHNSTRRTSCRR